MLDRSGQPAATAAGLTRRSLLGVLAGAACSRSVPSPAPASNEDPFRLAVCNETFQGSPFDEGCRLARETGYTGLEIAPWTLSDDPAAVSAEVRAACRAAMGAEGIRCVGLHSLLTAPAGQLHITTPDDAVRTRSWEYFRKLIDLCADLEGDRLMILGSGKQRSAVEGSSVDDAVKRLTDGLASAAPHARSQDVTIMIETLAPHLCDVLTSMDDTMEVVRQIGNSAVQTMFDTHNAVAERMPHDQLIEKYISAIKHVHINEMDGRGPGTGSYDFAVPLRALKEVGYDGWISLEVFQFEPDGETVARRSAQILREIESTL
ncbi:MAG: sugar phosphate isomerase/epimerase [Acidobacteria bacterium]|nr:sugar phosphate isomerase/epimerase [Acidobacteriota bacterium]MDA1235609.1 sugar phosphate isomerase/epimerase [Acidobacteriota bacterium]